MANVFRRSAMVLLPQGRRDVEVEDGVVDERPTYVFAGGAKKIKVQNSDDPDS